MMHSENSIFIEKTVKSLCNDLRYSEKTYTKAMKIVDDFERANPPFHIKALELSGSAVYIAAILTNEGRMTNTERVTQKRIEENLGLSRGSIGRSYRRLRDHIKIEIEL